MDASPAPAFPPKPQPMQRIASVDAYRGFVMFLMMAEVLRIAKVAAGFPESDVWQALKFHTSHVEWTGCSLHDLIQPSFSFLVGVALPFSIAARAAKGQSRGVMTQHACWRAAVLVLLGVFLRSVGKAETNWTFEDTLSQIGLGYPLLFALGFLRRRWQWTALGVILFGYWLAWALWEPVPPCFTVHYDDLDPSFGLSSRWSHDAMGFASHWNKNQNIGLMFDQRFLNSFPRSMSFIANPGGYLTLSFIPTLGTMLLGLLAGGWLREERAPREKLIRLASASVACFALALALHATGVCPIVKRIWTPGWALFSAGWCFALLAAFYLVMVVRGWRRWAFPLTVIGVNSIAAYVIAHLFHGFINDSLKTHLGAGFFDFAGENLTPLMQGATVLLIYWLILFWMYRRKIFLKV